MRNIHVSDITETVARLCVEANYNLPEDVMDALNLGMRTEQSDLGKNILSTLVENADIARNEKCPICQDTGVAVVFVEIGQDAHVDGGSLEAAINEGVRHGYERGYLRKSVVADPIKRVNTNDNTPAVIHYDIVEGDGFKITVVPKGFGSENMSALKMLKPSDGIEGVTRFVIETAKNAGPNACPPIILGIGIGGTMEKAALLAKKALLRKLGERHPDEFWAGFEIELLDGVNRIGFGPGGLGGKTSCLGVSINTYPTHIAGLPVAVNMSCHATRHAEAEL